MFPHAIFDLQFDLQSGVYTYPLGTAGLTFLSPKPKKLVHQYDTLITPVQDIVWIFLLVFLGIIIVCMYKTSRLEEDIIPDKRLKHWSKFGNAIWYAFSTLIGESVTRDSKSDGAWALR